MVRLRRVEDPNDAQRIPFRDNFTARWACHFAGPEAGLHGCCTMMVAAVMGTITLCVGAYALASPRIQQTYLRNRSVKELRAHARADALSAAAAGDAGAALQVPIHKTTTKTRTEQ
jgi:hypothetical protein